MKNRYSNDQRVTRANGQVSEIRVLIIEALEALAAEGATSEDLFQLIGGSVGSDNPKISIGKSLSNMDADGYIVHSRGRWYLKEHTPQANNTPNTIVNIVDPRANGKIAPMVQKRSGKTISLYTTPKVYGDAIAIAMLIGERWWKIPFFASVRICIGGEAPNWSPEQEMYTDVTVLKITHKNGQVSEERPAPKDIVTIAAEE